MADVASINETLARYVALGGDSQIASARLSDASKGLDLAIAAQSATGFITSLDSILGTGVYGAFSAVSGARAAIDLGLTQLTDADLAIIDGHYRKKLPLYTVVNI